MTNKASKIFIVVISIVVGVLHFVIGPGYNLVFPLFVKGYLMDILLPMNLYLLFQISFRNKTSVKSSRVFGSVFTLVFAFWVEFLQLKGYNILGNTFDSLDFLMYAFGVLLGLLLDLTIIKRLENKIQTM